MLFSVFFAPVNVARIKNTRDYSLRTLTTRYDSQSLVLHTFPDEFPAVTRRAFELNTFSLDSCLKCEIVTKRNRERRDTYEIHQRNTKEPDDGSPT